MTTGRLRALWIRSARMALGLVLGAVVAPAELGFVILAGLAVGVGAAWSPTRRSTVRGTAAVARWLTGFARWRLIACYGELAPAASGTAGMVGYLSVRWLAGLLGGVMLLLFGYGVSTTVLVVWSWAHGVDADGIPPAPWIVMYLVVAGLVVAFLVVQGMFGVVRLERRLARWLLGPTRRAVFERRISELAESRAATVAAVDEERRRIERDLHDGVQQRLVALGMLLGRVPRATEPVAAADLVRQAHTESQRALEELREVAWRVYPTTLDSGGLGAALETVAERSVLPVDMNVDLNAPLDRAVETAVYFIVCEAVTNAVKHSGANRVTVHAICSGNRVVVSVHDDGVGGADPAGGGLTGLSRRVAALDGSLRVVSPPGGPTVIIAEVPCG